MESEMFESLKAAFGRSAKTDIVIKMNAESVEVAEKLGDPWSPHPTKTGAVAVIARLGDGIEVLVVIFAHEVSVCIRQNLPNKITFPDGSSASVTEYLTPFTPILYRPKEPMEAHLAVREALKTQLDYVNRVREAYKKVVEVTQ
jgi:hypothetical protein